MFVHHRLYGQTYGAVVTSGRFFIVSTTLHQADSLLLVQPDSALALLERMPHERGALSRKNAARYALLWAQATDKCFQSLLPCDSLLDVALRYYKDANPDRALALLYKGRLEDEVGRPDEAVRLLQEAHIIMKAYPEDMENKAAHSQFVGQYLFFFGQL